METRIKIVYGSVSYPRTRIILSMVGHSIIVVHPFILTADIDILVNNTLGSMAATVRTDSDRSVVTATLEAVEDLLKALRSLSFPMQDRVLSSLVVSVQDILDNKVHVHVYAYM